MQVDHSMKSGNTFYVYKYLRSKPTGHGPVGSPYYIGKGKGRRVYSTQDRTSFVPKDKKNIVIVSTGMNEADAFQLEMLLIHLYGRIDNGKGCLRNRTDGGDGPSGWVPSEETREKMSGKARERWTKLTEGERRKLSDARKRGWANLPPEARLELSNTRKARWKNLTEEGRREQRTKQRAGQKKHWAILTQDQKRDFSRNRKEWYARLPEEGKLKQNRQLIVGRLKHLAGLTDEELLEYRNKQSENKKLWHASLTKEQKHVRAEAMRAWHANLTESGKRERNEVISKATREQWANLPEEEKRKVNEAKKKGWASLTEEQNREWRGKVGKAHKERIANLAEDKKRELNKQLHNALLGRWARTPKKTHCPQGHPYDEKNTYTDPRGGQHCKICVKDSKNRSRAKRARH